MNAPALRCAVEGGAPVAVVRLAGVLNVATAPVVRATVLRCLAAQPDLVVLDVSGMAVVDDVVLTVFPAISRHAAGWPGTALVLAAAGTALAAAMDRMTVYRYVPSYPTVAQAIAGQRTAGPAQRLHEWFEPVPRSLAMARAFVDRVCRGWGLPGVSEVAQLVATELVANGVRHARTEMELSLAVRRRHLHVAVRDRCPEPARLVGALDEFAEGGRGLIVVAALTASWGCTPTGDGKAVWATLRLSAPAVP